MAPSQRVVADAIRNTVRHMFTGPDRDSLTVNNVRNRVEAELHLGSGFLKEGTWKQESKSIVKAENEKLLKLEAAGEELPLVPSPPARTKASPVKKSTSGQVQKSIKRSPGGGKVQVAKHRKKEETDISEDEDSALTSINDTAEDSDDNYVSDVPKTTGTTTGTKKSAVKAGARQQARPKVDEEKENTKRVKIGDKSKLPDSESHKNTISEKISAHGKSDAPRKKSPDFRDGEKGDDENMELDSDMSIVLNEVLKRQRKSKSTPKGKLSISTSKSSKTSKTTKTADLSPDEVEIKTLQSQLSKCGIRKIWGVILKEYGSDAKAKIRHLKGMLKDVGMEGRFSEAKARAIKETRELEADLAAVKEGDAKWGMGREVRSQKGSERKKMSETSDDDEDENEDKDGDEDEAARRGRSAGQKPPARFARAKMDLAFLGDEESDSDD